MRALYPLQDNQYTPPILRIENRNVKIVCLRPGPGSGGGLMKVERGEVIR